MKSYVVFCKWKQNIKSILSNIKMQTFFTKKSKVLIQFYQYLTIWTRYSADYLTNNNVF